MNISDERLDWLEQQVDRLRNCSLMFQVQLLREIGEVKDLIKESNKDRNNEDKNNAS